MTSKPFSCTFCPGLANYLLGHILEVCWPPDVRGGLGIVSLGGAWDRFPGVAWGLGIVSWPDQLLGFGVPARPTTRQNPYPTHPSFSRLHFSGGPLPPPFSLSRRAALFSTQPLSALTRWGLGYGVPATDQTNYSAFVPARPTTRLCQ